MKQHVKILVPYLEAMTSIVFVLTLQAMAFVIKLIRSVVKSPVESYAGNLVTNVSLIQNKYATMIISMMEFVMLSITMICVALMVEIVVTICQDGTQDARKTMEIVSAKNYAKMVHTVQIHAKNFVKKKLEESMDLTGVTVNVEAKIVLINVKEHA